MKLFRFFCLLLIITVFSCNKNKKEDILEIYKKPEILLSKNTNTNNINDELYKNNFININNNCPFYILKLEAPLLLKKPSDMIVPDECFILRYGDIVFPVKEDNPIKYFFYVRTIDNKYGWIYSGYGISVDYNEDPNLYFFGDEYYLKFYKEVNGNIDNSNKIILAKNVVPMLLGNFITEGWFYPEDYQLALQISQYSASIVQNKKTRFYAASIVYNWNYHEILISNNLLADSYQKLGFLNKAKELHEYLKKNYFWSSYDNSPLVGGLNSIVKLEIIYLEELKNEKIGSQAYKNIEEKIIENIIIVGDKYSVFPALDKKWPNLTFAEWLLDILRRSVSRNEFYSFSEKLMERTQSEGFADMVRVYMAVEMYKDGRREEALDFLTNYKSKSYPQMVLRINDWLSINKIIPDTIIYQYNMF